jgi:hypothetical protein
MMCTIRDHEIDVCFELRPRPLQRLKIQLEKHFYLPYHLGKTGHGGKPVQKIYIEIWILRINTFFLNGN